MTKISNKHIIITYCLGLITEATLAIAAVRGVIWLIGWLLERITNLITMDMIPWVMILIFGIAICACRHDRKNSIEAEEGVSEE